MHAVTGQGVSTVHRVGLPRYPDKHLHEEFLSPAVMREWRRARGILPERVPDTMILLYQNLLYNGIIEYGGTTPLRRARRHLREDRDARCHRRTRRHHRRLRYRHASPAVILEDLAALGVQRFLSIGTAGGLQARDLAPGDVVLCTEPVRDEGVSYHYAPADAPAEPDPALTDALERADRRRAPAVPAGRDVDDDTPYRRDRGRSTALSGNRRAVCRDGSRRRSSRFAVRGRSARDRLLHQRLTRATSEWNHASTIPISRNLSVALPRRVAVRPSAERRARPHRPGARHGGGGFGASTATRLSRR